MSKFAEDIKKFNGLYKMASNNELTNLGPERVLNFVNILQEELTEHAAVVDLMNSATRAKINVAKGYLTKDALIGLADLLGDIIVYSASEMRRWGIPMDEVLDAIMESNFSKLNPDGTASYDERGKLIKGPDFKSPESKIEEILFPKEKK